MARRKTIAEARDNLARLIHEVEDGEPIEITRRGHPVAVLVSVEAMERLRSGKTGFWEAVTRFREQTDLATLQLAQALEDTRDSSDGRTVEL